MLKKNLSINAFLCGAALIVFSISGCEKKTESISQEQAAPPQTTSAPVQEEPAAKPTSEHETTKHDTTSSSGHKTKTSARPTIIVAPAVHTNPNANLGQAAEIHRAVAAPIRRSLYYNKHHNTNPNP